MEIRNNSLDVTQLNLRNISSPSVSGGGGSASALFNEINTDSCGDTVSFSTRSSENIERKNDKTESNFLNTLWNTLKNLTQGITSEQADSACDADGPNYTRGEPNTTVTIKDFRGDSNTYTYDDKGEVCEIKDNDGNITYSAKKSSDGSVQITTIEYKDGIPTLKKVHDKATGKLLVEDDCYKIGDGSFITDTKFYNAEGVVIGMLHTALAEDGSWKSSSYSVNKDGSCSLNSINYYEKGSKNPSKTEKYSKGRLESIETFNSDGSLKAKDTKPVSDIPEFLLITGGKIEYDEYNGCARVIDTEGRITLQENEDGTIDKYDYSKKPKTSYTYSKNGTLLKSIKHYSDCTMTTTYGADGQKDITTKTDRQGRLASVVLENPAAVYNPPETFLSNRRIEIYDVYGRLIKYYRYNLHGRLT